MAKTEMNGYCFLLALALPKRYPNALLHFMTTGQNNMPISSSSRTPCAIVLLSALLCACQAPPAVQIADEAPGVRSSIQQAIVRADRKKEAMQDAAVPASLNGNTMTVIWEGDAAEILKRIAIAQKLEFRLTGPQPRLPLPVFLKLRQATLTDALSQIGEQCGGRAEVVLTDSAIELRSKLY